MAAVDAEAWITRATAVVVASISKAAIAEEAVLTSRVIADVVASITIISRAVTIMITQVRPTRQITHRLRTKTTTTIHRRHRRQIDGIRIKTTIFLGRRRQNTTINIRTDQAAITTLHRQQLTHGTEDRVSINIPVQQAPPLRPITRRKTADLRREILAQAVVANSKKGVWEVVALLIVPVMDLNLVP